MMHCNHCSWSLMAYHVLQQRRIKLIANLLLREFVNYVNLGVIKQQDL